MGDAVGENAEKRGDREGKRYVAAWISDRAARQLKAAAALRGETVQAFLLLQAINLRFVAIGTPPVAE